MRVFLAFVSMVAISACAKAPNPARPVAGDRGVPRPSLSATAQVTPPEVARAPASEVRQDPLDGGTPHSLRLEFEDTVGPNVRFAFRNAAAAQAAVLVAETLRVDLVMRDSSTASNLDILVSEPSAVFGVIAEHFGLAYANEKGLHVLGKTEVVQHWLALGRSRPKGRAVDMRLYDVDANDILRLLVPFLGVKRSGYASARVTLWLRNRSAGEVLRTVCGLDDCQIGKNGRLEFAGQSGSEVTQTSKPNVELRAVTLPRTPIASIKLVGLSLTAERTIALVAADESLATIREGDWLGSPPHLVVRISAAGVELDESVDGR